MGGHTVVSNASRVPAGNRAMTSKASGLREPLRGMGARGRTARGVRGRGGLPQRGGRQVAPRARGPGAPAGAGRGRKGLRLRQSGRGGRGKPGAGRGGGSGRLRGPGQSGGWPGARSHSAMEGGAAPGRP